MNELQKAAELLNENAPVDGPFGKERIAYVNPLEEKLLKSLGGSGHVVIPEAGTPSYAQSRILPEGYRGVTSYRVPDPTRVAFKKPRNWWEEFKDDVLGIDDSKFFGIKKHTALGKALHKVGDTIGFNENRTLGIKDSTVGDIAKTLVTFGGVPGWAAWAAMNAYEVNEALENADKYQDSLAQFGTDFAQNYDPRNFTGLRYQPLSNLYNKNSSSSDASTRLTPRERSELRGGTSNMENIQRRINSVPSYSMTAEDADAKAIATSLINQGKSPIFNPSDLDKSKSLIASPGDPNYDPDFSKGGQYNTPFPDYLKETGDTILDTVEETGKFAQDYQNTADQRMFDFQPILDRLKGMNLDAISSVGSIFDKDEGGLENKYRNFNTQQDNLAEQLKQLNMMMGYDNQNNLENYLSSIVDAKQEEADLTNRSFDARRSGATAQNRQAMNLANAGLRNLNALNANNSGKSMANAMISARLGQEMADNIASAEVDRYAKLAEVNPASGRLEADKERVRFGDQILAAAGTNIGVDQGMIDADKALENEIINNRLSNLGLIPYVGQMAAQLPALQLEAALAPINPLLQYSAPFSSIGTLPAPTEDFQPAPAADTSPSTFDYFKMAPDILNLADDGYSAYKRLIGGK